MDIYRLDSRRKGMQRIAVATSHRTGWKVTGTADASDATVARIAELAEPCRSLWEFADRFAVPSLIASPPHLKRECSFWGGDFTPINLHDMATAEFEDVNDRIEAIVGVKRHPTAHYGRAVSAESRVYILHSELCCDARADLRTCPFSLSLDRGIHGVRDLWEGHEDKPVRLRFAFGLIAPYLPDQGGET